MIDDKLKKKEILKKELISLDGRRGTKIRQDKIKKLKNEIGRIKEYSKLVFVSLSRAKGIVAYGISQDRYKKYLKNKIEKDKWVIKEIS